MKGIIPTSSCHCQLSFYSLLFSHRKKFSSTSFRDIEATPGGNGVDVTKAGIENGIKTKSDKTHLGIEGLGTLRFPGNLFPGYFNCMYLALIRRLLGRNQVLQTWFFDF